MFSYCLPVAAFLASCALAQEVPPALHGTWTATAGPNQVLRGTWAAQAPAETPNTVSGSWTLLDDAGEVSLQGTWSARKTRLGWQGTWLAQAVHGGLLRGTWTADSADLSGKTLREMLELSTAKEIAGSWRSGRYEGHWWLKGVQYRGR